MLAGEISMILLSAKVSTTFSETLDDAAPMTTDGLLSTSVPAEAVETVMSVESPESWMSWQAGAPLTPPAALMSETARPTPAISGGPRKARLPVSGRMPPTRKVSALVCSRRALVVGERVGRGSFLRGGRRGGVFGCGVVVSVGGVVAAGCQGEAEDGSARHQPYPCGGFGSIHGVNLSVALLHFTAPALPKGWA